ncbi:MAG: hexokinase [Megasphaera sp.]|jgi:hexokinase|nr:hexokinase [Megasphaera sp.]MCH4188313.1 hexokinase [Megasphaera sp.]
METTQIDWMAIAQYFYIDDEQLQSFSLLFSKSIEAALNGEPSTLSAVKSYMGLPTGDEQGVYLALDFGGTNVRASRVRLLGNHCFLVEKKVSRPLKQPGKYDYMSNTTTATELFDFIADIVREAAGGNKPFKLGHTFSFGVEQTDASDAVLIDWSKEIDVPGVAGKKINTLLYQALQRAGLDAIEPVAILNDTTAALLASSYQHGKVNIAVVCGTGFNICYYEPAWKMIVILEAGGYEGASRNEWDNRVDAASHLPGNHKLEKMVSGGYLGELYRQTVMTYFNSSAIPHFTTKDMNELLQSESPTEGRIHMGKLWHRIVRPQDVQPLRNIGATIFVRSAQLTGASCYGVLHHLYPKGRIPKQHIAVEGSVLAHIRGGMIMVEDAIRACQAGNCHGHLQSASAEPVLVQDGPSIGAAIAAAMCTHRK